MTNGISQRMSRRAFLKVGGMGVAAALVPSVAGQVVSAKSAASGKKLAMVIDLQRCVGCGACIMACKNENNVQENVAWASRITRTTGNFPNVKYEYIPTLCNHCERAPCVRGCPTGAMHKIDGDITANDPNKCIGCRYCIINCPYGVIHFNEHEPHTYWKNTSPVLQGITASPPEVTRKVSGTVIPYYNPARELSDRGAGLRRRGVVEKCGFCHHRVYAGQLPYCVEACPASARVFGDLNDPNSDVSKILTKYHGWRLKEELGTGPKIYYVREFNPANYERTKGSA